MLDFFNNIAARMVGMCPPFPAPQEIGGGGSRRPFHFFRRESLSMSRGESQIQLDRPLPCR
jgi:hypothetical protein